MLKRNATLNISLAEGHQRGQTTCVLSSCWQFHVNCHIFELPEADYYLDGLLLFGSLLLIFLFCFVFFPRMLIKEPCWRDYSRLWKLWRSPNVIIRSTSCLMFAEVTGVGSAFNIWMCAWAWGFIIQCSTPKLTRSDVLQWKLDTWAHVFHMSDCWCYNSVGAGMCSGIFRLFLQSW